MWRFSVSVAARLTAEGGLSFETGSLGADSNLRPSSSMDEGISPWLGKLTNPESIPVGALWSTARNQTYSGLALVLLSTKRVMRHK
jgi:hypothetical protein